MTARTPGEHDTETMAHLYLEQGKVAEAAAIYRRLLDGAADDAGEIRRLTELLADSEARRARARRRVAEAVAEACPGVDLCVLVPLGPGQATCLWEVTRAGRAAARRQLAGEPGRLVLRVVVVAPGPPGAALGRWGCDHDAPTDAGEQLVTVPTEGGLAIAAVGLATNGGGFAAIAHAPPRLTIPARARAASAPLWLEVAPAEGGPDPEPAEGLVVPP